MTVNETAPKNTNLNVARSAKNDEFYTPYEVVDIELQNYLNCFQGKTVLLPCDDPRKSAFFKWFLNHYRLLGLRKLVAIGYAGRPESGGVAVKATITNVPPGSGWDDTESFNELIVLEGNSLTVLEGDGDFRHCETRDDWQEADVIVTNPPFSLFREFYGLARSLHKDFLLVGALPMVIYKDIWPDLYEGTVRLGVNQKGVTFFTPTGVKKLNNTCWFTTLQHGHTPALMELKWSYHENRDYYQKFDNFDAINVARSNRIPYDYDGVMGVPISFLPKINPEQFKIVGLTNQFGTTEELRLPCNKGYSKAYIDGKGKFNRVLIQPITQEGN